MTIDEIKAANPPVEGFSWISGNRYVSGLILPNYFRLRVGDFVEFKANSRKTSRPVDVRLIRLRKPVRPQSKTSMKREARERQYLAHADTVSGIANRGFNLDECQSFAAVTGCEFVHPVAWAKSFWRACKKRNLLSVV